MLRSSCLSWETEAGWHEVGARPKAGRLHPDSPVLPTPPVLQDNKPLKRPQKGPRFVNLAHLLGACMSQGRVLRIPDAHRQSHSVPSSVILTTCTEACFL